MRRYARLQSLGQLLAQPLFYALVSIKEKANSLGSRQRQRVQAFQLEEAVLREERTQGVSHPIFFSYGTNKTAALLERWVKDKVTRLPYVERFLSLAYQRDTNYCPYHWRKTHPWKFDEKHKSNDILLQNVEQVISTTYPFKEQG